ncbi:hypothetical protein FRZ67_16580 [Panacibacter ginsenosidivorans]|uniref:Uncharacterized protein n=1 Tax=Panacibacter ginsenosidivorans TaxID=1813871 RepID=A0A5B8VCX8_9BACT|nr:hypothetical protein [Panacibacter ginsenosidivorans]QEC68843.1 hypothetical protein FRZ67_16580 [Panacibacter ginsenosidivorans]
MKKIFAILLVAVYLLNLAGYSLLFDYFINCADELMVEELDNGNYNEAALIEIKVPMDLPYGPQQMEYERFDGEIELNGIHYNYVKRKVYNDTLYLFCVPNLSKTQLNNARTAYAGSSSDVTNPASEKKQSEPFAKKITSENECNKPDNEYLIFTAVASLQKYQLFSPHLSTCFLDSPEQPPDISC